MMSSIHIYYIIIIIIIEMDIAVQNELRKLRKRKWILCPKTIIENYKFLNVDPSHLVG